MGVFIQDTAYKTSSDDTQGKGVTMPRSDMQLFYDQLQQVLISGEAGSDPLLARLARLTRATRTQLAALQSDLAWTVWAADTAAAGTSRSA